MFSVPLTLAEAFFAFLGGLALVGAMFVFTPVSEPVFSKLIERRRRAFLVGAGVLYVGLLVWPFLTYDLPRMVRTWVG